MTKESTALQAAPYDTAIELLTPENIAFHYRVAGPFRRLPAFFIDLMIRGALVFGVWMAAAMIFAFALDSEGLMSGAVLIVWYLTEWFYGALFEAFWNGQTPGKRLTQLRVMTADGQPINAMQAVLRNFLRVVDGMPFVTIVFSEFPPISFAPPVYAVGLLAAAATPKLQRLGDLLANTVVVIESPQQLYGVVRVAEPEVVELARRIPKDFQPTRSLARSLSDYVSRRKGFSWSRRAEIAAHIGEPLRKQFDLPLGTSHDLLLCALYHRIFMSEEVDSRSVDVWVVNDENANDKGPWSPAGGVTR